jgi:hypothetical protein
MIKKWGNYTKPKCKKFRSILEDTEAELAKTKIEDLTA